MKTLIIATFFFVTCAQIHAQYTTSIKRIYSAYVKDSFDIYITIPQQNDSAAFDGAIYYLDANLKSGKELRQAIDNDQRRLGRKFIFIGIGHIGNYHQLRRRDFILPFIKNGDTIPKSPQYGQIALFYEFLTKELVPFIDARYSTPRNRTILGHSLGGLFAIYCLFRNEGVFDKYYALSPALWIELTGASTVAKTTIRK